MDNFCSNFIVFLLLFLVSCSNLRVDSASELASRSGKELDSSPHYETPGTLR